jgi:hypothetical protein
MYICPFYFFRDACTEFWAILLVLCIIPSILLWSLSFWEAHACMTWFMHYKQGGEMCIQFSFITRGTFASRGIKHFSRWILSSWWELEFASICSAGAYIHAWEALCVSWMCFVLCSFVDGVESFVLPSRSQCCECFVSVVLSRFPCHRGLRLALSSDLLFGLCLAFDQLFENFVRFFYFSFFSK